MGWLSDLGLALPAAFSAGTPFYAYWVVLAVLVLTALKDARTGRIPSAWIYGGCLYALAVSYFFESPSTAGARLTVALVVYAALRLINEIYYRLIGNDPYGYGDMRWSALAGLAFGVMPVIWAWVIGAWLGVVFLLLAAMARFIFDRGHGPAYIHFAPFLMVGLAVNLFAQNGVWRLLARLMP